MRWITHRAHAPAQGRSSTYSTWDAATPRGNDLDRARTLEDVEREAIRAALAAHGGNVLHAAKALGLSRSALYRRLERYGL